MTMTNTRTASKARWPSHTTPNSWHSWHSFRLNYEKIVEVVCQEGMGERKILTWQLNIYDENAAFVRSARRATNSTPHASQILFGHLNTHTWQLLVPLNFHKLFLNSRYIKHCATAWKLPCASKTQCTWRHECGIADNWIYALPRLQENLINPESAPYVFSEQMWSLLKKKNYLCPKPSLKLDGVHYYEGL